MRSISAGLSPDQLNTVARNTVLLREAEAIASALEKKGIPAIFLKGIGLLETAYASLAARSMGDIDLLVRARDLDEVTAVLGVRGYAPRPNAMVRSKSVAKIPVDIDLHADLWFFGGDNFWLRSRFKDASSVMRILCSGDAFLHCILHSVIQDGGISGQALADCRAILAMEGGGFSWNQFAATVAAEGWEKPVAMFLEGLEARFPGTVPQPVLEGVPWSPARFGRSRTYRTPYVRMLAMQSRWGRRTQLFLSILFPHPLFLRMRYSWVPRRLAFVLPILRPFLLLAECVSCRLDASRP